MQLLSELRRRNVFRVAAAYVVVGWLLVQASDVVFPRLGLPEWTVTFVILLVVLGLPLALFLAWAYELTPDGVRRSAEVYPAESARPQTGRRLDWVILAGLALVIAVVVADRVWFTPSPIPADAVTRQQVKAVDPEGGPEATQAVTDRSIAVLPFADMSPGRDQEYFSDGLSEEILNLLAQIRELKVIGRSSSFAFKGRNVDLREIGEALGVAHLLEGSVRKAGDDLRITAQLIRADTGAHLWSQSYDRRLENVFAIQSEIARSVAEALRARLVGPDDAAPVAQATASMPAYERFLQARRLIQGRTRAGIEAARGLLDEAVALDPDYAPAHAAAAQAVLLLSDTPTTYGDLPLEQAVAAAQPLIDRALALDPNLAEAHAVQGLLYSVQRSFERSEAALVRALELNPSLSDARNWRASHLRSAGRLRENLAGRQRLAELDPLNVANLSNLSIELAQSGQWTEANALAQRIQRGFPDSPFAFVRQAQMLAFAGRLAEARTLAEKALELGPDSTWVTTRVGQVFYAVGDHGRVLTFSADAGHGLALLALGQVDEALAAARERLAAAPKDYFAAYDLLRTLSLAGHHDEVLAVYHELWDDLAGVEAAIGFDIWTRELALVAAAQRALGRHEALAETLQSWSDRLAFMREQGYDFSGFRFIEASYLALAGERDEALAALVEAIDLGHRDPLLDIDPAFADLHDDPTFQVQVARMIELINAERAELGMEPMSRASSSAHSRMRVRNRSG